jgi:hypothetical protein
LEIKYTYSRNLWRISKGYGVLNESYRKNLKTLMYNLSDYIFIKGRLNGLGVSESDY